MSAPLSLFISLRHVPFWHCQMISSGAWRVQRRYLSISSAHGSYRVGVPDDLDGRLFDPARVKEGPPSLSWDGGTAVQPLMVQFSLAPAWNHQFPGASVECICPLPRGQWILMFKVPIYAQAHVPGAPQGRHYPCSLILVGSSPQHVGSEAW